MICENCKSEFEGKYSKLSSGRFCSLKCARGFSTKLKRLEINKKVSETVNKKYMEIQKMFMKMDLELSSDYPYKYDLLRNYVMEVIHTGQKLTPMASIINSTNASSRISSLFIELLERQFPIENNAQIIQIKAASDFANRLGVHINHLNKVLKETTGKSTTEIINGRIAEEAKILLKQTQLNVSEIAFALGFDEVSHFSNFFKKHTAYSLLQYRN